ncbi:MAG: hypothetical protein WC682_00165 [Parcubacteria group bacterium]|jgi:hypothetical protein
MCWRDNISRARMCSLCGQEYYGDLGHRNCPALEKEEEPEEKVIKLNKDFWREFYE